MSDSRIFGNTLEMLSKSLDVSSRRHNLITGNIANMDTIGYKPKDLDFSKTLERIMTQNEPEMLARTDQEHYATSSPNKTAMNGSISEEVDIYHLDSVNIDTEMINLVENNIKYRTTTEMLLRKMSILKYSIDEGGR